jgi:hypothetical protein
MSRVETKHKPGLKSFFLNFLMFSFIWGDAAMFLDAVSDNRMERQSTDLV